MKFIGFYDYTVVLTYISLISGLCGMRFAQLGRPGRAICCLILSGVCDLFDGVVARSKKGRTADQRNFGIQIDSLCDTVCFGVLPAAFLYFNGVDSLLGIALLLLYVLCAVIRLGFFNVLEAKRQTNEGGCAKEYRGLPVTSAAIVFPLFYLIGLLLPDNVTTLIYHIVAAVCAVLFISDFRVPKLDIGKLLRRSDASEELTPCPKQECVAEKKQ